MKQELIKPIVRVGNSAGIVLPKDWCGGKARVELIKKPLNINKDVLEILEKYLCDIQGIYLVGSYARGEQTEKSDVDILVVTNKISKKIEQGKYNFILISKKQVENSLKNNVLPILPMFREAKSILNDGLILNYKKTILTKKNLRWHIETTKSAMKMNKAALELDKLENKKISDNVMYSLILRLREIYIVDCLIKNKKSLKKEFLNLVKNISGSVGSYEAYLRSKNNEKTKKVIFLDDAIKIYEYVVKKINEQEKWLIKRKS